MSQSLVVADHLTHSLSPPFFNTFLALPCPWVLLLIDTPGSLCFARDFLGIHAPYPHSFVPLQARLVDVEEHLR